ncbi:hypothetical protein BJV74DRAFT_867045 [Russula compacta]|nr:hypothetical protein BJV74DRAFT_867045 [Russula compacta]
MVMPFLRPFNDPRFQTYGEFVAFFMQISEGLKFMHERRVAHRWAWYLPKKEPILNSKPSQGLHSEQHHV